MSLFEGRVYDSYAALMRELHLEWEFKEFDAVLCPDGSIFEWHFWVTWWEAKGAVPPKAEVVPLPRLDQWVDLIAEAIFAKHPEFRLADGARYLARRDALSRILGLWNVRPDLPVEQVAAYAWCELTGRTVMP